MIEILQAPDTLESKVRFLAGHYSKAGQTEKAREELRELLAELDKAHTPMWFDELLRFPDNTWSECADVVIMIWQLAIQHGKVEKVREQMEFKLNRQIRRIEG